MPINWSKIFWRSIARMIFEFHVYFQVHTLSAILIKWCVYAYDYWKQTALFAILYVTNQGKIQNLIIKFPQNIINFDTCVYLENLICQCSSILWLSGLPLFPIELEFSHCLSYAMPWKRCIYWILIRIKGKMGHFCITKAQSCKGLLKLTNLIQSEQWIFELNASA